MSESYAEILHFDGLVRLIRELSKPCECELPDERLHHEIECHEALLSREWYIAPIVGRNCVDVDSEAA